MICMTDFRTLKLKKPTVDLLFDKGFLYISGKDGLIGIA